MKRYKVTLTTEEREQLEALIHRGKSNARVLNRARILLKTDAAEQGLGWTDERIKEAMDISIPTVQRIRKRFVLENFDAALYDRRHAGRPKSVMCGKEEAHLIALACSAPPEGKKCWTMQLLADRMIELSYVEHVGRETVRCALKKMNLSLGVRRVG